MNGQCETIYGTHKRDDEKHIKLMGWMPFGTHIKSGRFKQIKRIVCFDYSSFSLVKVWEGQYQTEKKIKYATFANFFCQ